MKIHPIPVFLALLAVLFVPTISMDAYGKTGLGWQFVFTPGLSTATSPLVWVVVVVELGLIFGLGWWLSRRGSAG